MRQKTKSIRTLDACHRSGVPGLVGRFVLISTRPSGRPFKVSIRSTQCTEVTLGSRLYLLGSRAGHEIDMLWSSVHLEYNTFTLVLYSTATLFLNPRRKMATQFALWMVLSLLLAIHAFGLSSMYGLAYRNGYYQPLMRIRDAGPPYYLPGSSLPVLTWYCGIGPMDRLLTLANMLFANVTDGSRPQLSLYAFQFGG